MTVATHQPYYLPWVGYFLRIYFSDIFVILDDVQFPLSRTWVTRNVIKGVNGRVWLTVPVFRKGLGLQKIKDVKIDNSKEWKKKHLLSLHHFYKHSPYFNDYIDFFNLLYNKNWNDILSLNMEIIYKILEWLEIDRKIYLLSEINVNGKGTDLLVNICSHFNANNYIAPIYVKKYLDENKFNEIKIKYYKFDVQIYPQLWFEFISNLSIIDLLFNCGKRGFDLQLSSCKIT